MADGSGRGAPVEHLDVLVVGAGISGIGAGYHLQNLCPDRSYAIFEGRAQKGGTWDLFRYPGIRSDSDMFTLGFSFKPWTEAKAIADGPSILKYLDATARQFRIEDKIRYRHRVTAADWDSATARWTVAYENESGEAHTLTCSFLFMCTGYYRYARGYRPDFAGEENFKGPIIEPQLWPKDLDYAGKRVVVIGSGATAVTLVPSMAETAAHVTMLQRSPTYVVSRPGEDKMANTLRRFLPAKLAYALIRWRNILGQQYIYNQARKNPGRVKDMLLKMVREQLGPDFDVETHFTPTYDPWTQRLCLVPDADLFKAIRQGSASVVTDQIETFTPEGIKLKSGQVLEADIIVAATGLELEVLGGLPIRVDGRLVEPGKTFNYKGFMFSDVPNLASVFGYINASWTLKADLIAVQVCRLLNRMKKLGADECRPVNDDPAMPEMPWFDFSSGYIQRGMPRMPKLGPAEPWIAHQNYLKDRAFFSEKNIEDGVMRFTKAKADARV